MITHEFNDLFIKEISLIELWNIIDRFMRYHGFTYGISIPVKSTILYCLVK